MIFEWGGCPFDKIAVPTLRLGNSVNPDQTPNHAASNRVLHCLLLIQHFYTHSLAYLPYVLGQTGLSKQCRPRSDAESDRGLHYLLLIQQFYIHSLAVK